MKNLLNNAHKALFEKLSEAGMYHHIAESNGISKGAYLVIDGKKTLNFGSLSILGFEKEREVLFEVYSNVFKYGIGCPSTLSLLESDIHRQLEEKLSEFKGENIFLLNTGFTASEVSINIFTKPLIALGIPVEKEYRYEAMIFYDEYAHNSLQGAIKTYDGKKIMHKHLDYDDLENLLKLNTINFSGKIIIVADALYSMNGTFANASRLIALAKKYQGIVILDGAHSDGVYGKMGSGILEMQGIAKEDYEYVVQVGVLSKAFSSIGGYITLPEHTCKLMKRAERKYMFTVGRPTFIEATDIFVTDLIMSEEGDRRRKNVSVVSQYLRDELEKNDFDIMESDSHIVPVVVGQEVECYKLKQYLFDKYEIFVNAIPRGVVSKGNALIRNSITAHHTVENAKQLIDALLDARKNGIKFKK